MSARGSQEFFITIGNFTLAVCSREEKILPDAELEPFLVTHAPDDAVRFSVRYAPAPVWPPGRSCYLHRSGWKLYRVPDGYRIVLPIPPETATIERYLSVPDGAEPGEIVIPPAADRRDRPFAYLATEILGLVLSARRPFLLMHAACAVLNGRGWLFAGKSGAGKSTLAEILARAGYEVVGDESHIVYSNRHGFFVSGTPWPGSSGLFKNVTAPLGGVFFIEHGGENRLQSVVPAAACAGILAQTFIPHFSKDAVENVGALAVDLAERVLVRRLAFAPDVRVADYVCRKTKDV